MRMRQQLIIVVALVFATVAVGVNVYAATRAADRHALQIDQTMPVASVLDRGVVESPPPANSSDEPPSAANAVAPDDPCESSEACHGAARNAPGLAFSNHGRSVSAYAKHIGFVDGEDGPPGASVRDIARPDIKADGPPRSDRAEERSNNSAAPGQNKDKDD